MNNWVTGWMDWNLALNTEGGPTYVGNYVDAPIIVNKTADEFYKQPMFYAMGHFSKFIRPNSIRVYSKNTAAELKTTVFMRPDNGTVIQIFNPYVLSFIYKLTTDNYIICIIYILTLMPKHMSAYSNKTMYFLK